MEAEERIPRQRKEKGGKEIVCVHVQVLVRVRARARERIKREGAHVMVSRDAQHAVPRSLSCSKHEHVWKPKEETEDLAARSSKQHRYRECYRVLKELSTYKGKLLCV